MGLAILLVAVGAERWATGQEGRAGAGRGWEGRAAGGPDGKARRLGGNGARRRAGWLGGGSEVVGMCGRRRLKEQSHQRWELSGRFTFSIIFYRLYSAGACASL
jgi:hypothetical protein